MRSNIAVCDEQPCPPVVLHAVESWLETFAKCVRSRDYDAGRQLFSDDVSAFGTVIDQSDTLDDLEAGQWRRVWGVTEEFDFLPGTLRVAGHDDLASVAVRWHSFGRRPIGTRFSRFGRATYVLRRTPDNVWLAVHSHHSISPDTRR